MRELTDVVRTVPTVSWVREADAVAFVRGNTLIRVRGNVDTLAVLADLLESGTTLHGLAEHAGRSVAETLVGRLDAEGWVTNEPPIPAENVPWERQLGYLTLFGPNASAMQSRLRDARIAVVGVGGIGALIAQHTVAAGVGEIHLIDFDVVASHNLNRQYLFTTYDIGTPKVEAAQTALAGLSEHTRVYDWLRAVRAPADLDGLPEDLNLLVVAADIPPDVASICWRWAAPQGIAMISAAVGLTSGYWGPLLDPDRGHCAECFHCARQDSLSDVERRLEHALAAPTPWSFGPTNSLVAALASYDICRYLASGSCASLGRRGIITFDPHRMSFYEPDPALRCAVHSGEVEVVPSVERKGA